MRDFNQRLAISSILSIAFISTVYAQTAPPTAGESWSPQSLQQVGLVGALMIAVIVLWKTLQQERAAAIAAIKIVTEALATSASANSELRRIIEESVAANNEVKDEIRLLRTSFLGLPCSLENSSHKV
jgi:hypothetical protein